MKGSADDVCEILQISPPAPLFNFKYTEMPSMSKVVSIYSRGYCFLQKPHFQDSDSYPEVQPTFQPLYKGV